MTIFSNIFSRTKNMFSSNTILNTVMFLKNFKKQKPWAIYETHGFDDDGKIMFRTYYNKAFIQNLKINGIEGENDEEAIMIFLIASQITPNEIFEDGAYSTNHPLLSSDSNSLKRGNS